VLSDADVVESSSPAPDGRPPWSAPRGARETSSGPSPTGRCGCCSRAPSWAAAARSGWATGCRPTGRSGCGATSTWARRCPAWRRRSPGRSRRPSATTGFAARFTPSAARCRPARARRQLSRAHLPQPHALHAVARQVPAAQRRGCSWSSAAAAASRPSSGRWSPGVGAVLAAAARPWRALAAENARLDGRLAASRGLQRTRDDGRKRSRLGTRLQDAFAAAA
jgi:hypothetical protein